MTPEEFNQLNALLIKPEEKEIIDLYPKIEDYEDGFISLVDYMTEKAINNNIDFIKTIDNYIESDKIKNFKLFNYKFDSIMNKEMGFNISKLFNLDEKIIDKSLYNILIAKESINKLRINDSIDLIISEINKFIQNPNHDNISNDKNGELLIYLIHNFTVFDYIEVDNTASLELFNHLKANNITNINRLKAYLRKFEFLKTSLGLDGGNKNSIYMKKYLKYKQKYLTLKNSISK